MSWATKQAGEGSITLPLSRMDLAAAKHIDILSLLGNWPLRRVAGTGGGEYSGPCPFCGGVDRFRVQPNHPEGGRWYCRGCGENRWHDTVAFVMKKANVNFPTAVQMLDPKQVKATPLKRPVEPNSLPTEIDRETWSAAAWKFLRDCISYMWQPEGDQAREYLHKRGLTDHTICRWLIGYNPFNGADSWRHWGVEPGAVVHLPAGITIPCVAENTLHYVKFRTDVGEPKYQMIKGSEYWLYGADTYKDSLMGMLFESELDVCLAWQSGLKIGYASIPAGASLIECWLKKSTVEDIVVAPDNDSRGDDGAAKICAQSSHIFLGDHVPAGKDLTEYGQAGGDILQWIYDQLEHIKCPQSC